MVSVNNRKSYFSLFKIITNTLQKKMLSISDKKNIRIQRNGHFLYESYIESCFLGAWKDPPLQPWQIDRLSARRTAHCPHSGMVAAAHGAGGLIQRNRLQFTPAWPLRHTGRTALYRGIAFNSLRHGRCGTQGGRPYTEESPSIHSGMVAAAHRAGGLRIYFADFPALYRGIAFNSLRHGCRGTQGGRVTDLFCRLACDRRPSGQRMLVKHGDFALLMLPGRNGSQ